MKSQITIDRDYPSSTVAGKVLASMQPDNREVPADTTIEMTVVDKAIRVVVTSTGSLPSFLRTVDDLLTCVQAAEAAIQGTR